MMRMTVAGLSLCWRVVLLENRDRTMVITVIAMGMVQDSFVEIILMIPMGHERMPTILMPARAGDRSALRGILGIDLKHMLIIMPLVHGVKMTIMQVIDMPIMHKRNMSTMLSMNMGMVIVNRMTHLPFLSKQYMCCFFSTV